MTTIDDEEIYKLKDYVMFTHDVGVKEEIVRALLYRLQKSEECIDLAEELCPGIIQSTPHSIWRKAAGK